jgi:hypothetical protein
MKQLPFDTHLFKVGRNEGLDLIQATDITPLPVRDVRNMSAPDRVALFIRAFLHPNLDDERMSRELKDIHIALVRRWFEKGQARTMSRKPPNTADQHAETGESIAVTRLPGVFGASVGTSQLVFFSEGLQKPS